jgi:uncharacterized membrane-anchored protein YjiN (DUF445 family)
MPDGLVGVIDKPPKKHDYSRIVTNMRYKYFDEETCGSAYFNDCNIDEKEIEIRDMIKRNQATKFRREKRKIKRQFDEELKKDDSVDNDSVPDDQGLLTTESGKGKKDK